MSNQIICYLILVTDDEAGEELDMCHGCYNLDIKPGQKKCQVCQADLESQRRGVWA